MKPIEARAEEERSREALAMRNLEEGLPLLKEESLQTAARTYKATTCGGCDGFRPLEGYA